MQFSSNTWHFPVGLHIWDKLCATVHKISWIVGPPESNTLWRHVIRFQETQQHCGQFGSISYSFFLFFCGRLHMWLQNAHMTAENYLCVPFAVEGRRFKDKCFIIRTLSVTQRRLKGVLFELSYVCTYMCTSINDKGHNLENEVGLKHLRCLFFSSIMWLTKPYDSVDWLAWNHTKAIAAILIFYWKGGINFRAKV